MASNTAFTGSVPEKYDRYLGPLLFDPYAQDLVARIDASSVHDVLEIACGTGRVTRYLQEALPNARLIATDLNSDMLAIAKALNHDGRVEWHIADAQDLHFDSEIADLVICQFGFMFMPDKAKAFAEAYRILKPGGRLLFNVWDELANNPLFYLANDIVNSYFPDNPPVFYQIPFSFHDRKQIRSLLEEAGFRNIEIELLQKEGVSPSAAEAATGIVQGNPVHAFIIERDPLLVDTIQNHVEKEIAAKYGGKPLKFPMQAWVCEAVKGE